MKSTGPFRTPWLLALGLTLLPPAGRAGVAAGDTFGLHVDRSSSAGGLGPLDDSTLQRVAQQLGSGQFFVRGVTAPGRNPATAARLFFVFPSEDALRADRPALLVYCSGQPPLETVRAGSPGEIVGACLAGEGAVDDELVDRKMPTVLSTVLYEGRGRLQDGGAASSDAQKPEPAVAGNPGSRAETRAGEPAAHLVRNAAGQLVWHGRFVRGDGAVEDVTATLPAQPEGRAVIEQVGVAGPVDSAASPPLAPAEKWVVSGESNWRLPPRYKMLATLAALGNPQKQFQLGTALLQENDSEAKAAGFKWLEAAAAGGYRDAALVLAQGREQLERPDRERDNVRVPCCRPAAGR